MQYPVDGYIRGFTHAFVIILFFLLGGGRLTSVIVWACLLYVLMWMKAASDEVMFYICLALGRFKIDLGSDTTALVTFSEVSNLSKRRSEAHWGSLGSF